MTNPSKDTNIQVMQLDHAKGLPLPAYKTAGAAGMDITAAIKTPLDIKPMERVALPTGLTMAIPHGVEVQIRPRSGLALNHGLTVANTPGTIDSDYRGEVKVLLINLGDAVVTINRGDRIAQMVVAPIVQAQLVKADVLDDTPRGSGGFGSTGA